MRKSSLYEWSMKKAKKGEEKIVIKSTRKKEEKIEKTSRRD
jgi:hypothetical protein